MGTGSFYPLVNPLHQLLNSLSNPVHPVLSDSSSQKPPFCTCNPFAQKNLYGSFSLTSSMTLSKKKTKNKKKALELNPVSPLLALNLGSHLISLAFSFLTYVIPMKCG